MAIHYLKARSKCTQKVHMHVHDTADHHTIIYSRPTTVCSIQIMHLKQHENKQLVDKNIIIIFIKEI